MSRRLAARLQGLYREACLLDVLACKPGNVSLHAAAHGMTGEDFVRSAAVSAPAMAAPDLPLGERILQAVSCTNRAVGCNTNLGIVLLCAPLAQAALTYPGEDLRSAVGQVLDAADTRDCRALYAAIALAAPGGLGQVPAHDIAVGSPLSVVGAMRLAAERDLVARQYAEGFALLFDTALPCLDDALAGSPHLADATTALFLHLLGRHPDSHIRRKHGELIAQRVSARARRLQRLRARGMQHPALWRGLRAFDHALKAAHLNPGTTADLCVAGLFLYRLQQQAGDTAGVSRHLLRSSRPSGPSASMSIRQLS